jgi:hypothetical protein
MMLMYYLVYRGHPETHSEHCLLFGLGLGFITFVLWRKGFLNGLPVCLALDSSFMTLP